MERTITLSLIATMLIILTRLPWTSSITTDSEGTDIQVMMIGLINYNYNSEGKIKHYIRRVLDNREHMKRYREQWEQAMQVYMSRSIITWKFDSD